MGKTAENCANYLAKGRMTAVQGRIQSRSYDDKDGRRVYVTEVVAQNVEFWNGLTVLGEVILDLITAKIPIFRV